MSIPATGTLSRLGHRHRALLRAGVMGLSAVSSAGCSRHLRCAAHVPDEVRSTGRIWVHPASGNALSCDRSSIASLNERPDSSPETLVGRLLRPREQLRVKTGTALLVTANRAFAMLGENTDTPRQDLL
jgi:hypothetical protein